MLSIPCITNFTSNILCFALCSESEASVALGCLIKGFQHVESIVFISSSHPNKNNIKVTIKSMIWHKEGYKWMHVLKYKYLSSDSYLNIR